MGLLTPHTTNTTTAKNQNASVYLATNRNIGDIFPQYWVNAAWRTFRSDSLKFVPDEAYDF